MFKLIEPMPSPRGTNKANLFIEARSRNPVAAYDAMPRPGRNAAARDESEEEREEREAQEARDKRARDEEENKEEIDAASTEKWLAYLSKCGVDSEEVAAIGKTLSKYCDNLIDPNGEPYRETESAEDRRRRMAGDSRPPVPLSWHDRQNLSAADRQRRAEAVNRHLVDRL